jgi:hypothetical protein
MWCHQWRRGLPLRSKTPALRDSVPPSQPMIYFGCDIQAGGQWWGDFAVLVFWAGGVRLQRGTLPGRDLDNLAVTLSVVREWCA